MQQQLHVDAAAVAAYTAAAADVAAVLGIAARSAADATDIDALIRDLGEIGRDFVTRWVSAVGGHVDALTAASGQIGHCGQALSYLADVTSVTDADVAAGISDAGWALA
ncbi:hypothetical protein [Nocardia wallacei]|uniref:ESX-1 secretion-associated protein n=1 Tax=Nocardia wallacei TaxID=480035 RepID=A0A7G1KSB8_9NOCA|nr:hypothetical protein [Nocardia wallacei]BCK57436.1 hypothetical protein NWFMUON74_52080 [Nocardia wallacei]